MQLGGGDAGTGWRGTDLTALAAAAVVQSVVVVLVVLVERLVVRLVVAVWLVQGVFP